MNLYHFVVHGLPVGQPRPRATARGGRARMYDPGTADAWKAEVAHEAARVIRSPIVGPVEMHLDFSIPRPRAHFGTGKHAARLRLTAPACHVQRPDLDNLIKAVMDALLGIAWRDDDQVIRLAASKEWTVEGSGCEIRISDVWTPDPFLTIAEQAGLGCAGDKP